MLPLLAILRHDLRTLAGSWLVRLWLVGAALLTLLLVSANWNQFQTAPLIASLLFPYLVFPWFLVVMVLGVTPISGSRVESLADGFLSRPVTRHEYLLAIWASRLVVVLGCYLVVVVPAVLLVSLASRRVPADQVTVYGTVAAIGVVGLVLTFQVSLGFFFGVLLRKPLLAIVVLLFVWYPANTLLDTFRMQAFSPITLSRAIPTLVRQPWRSAEADPGDRPHDQELEELRRQAANFLNVLSGGGPQKPPEHKGQFFEEQFNDFSLARVVLGYGLPTLAAIGLATLCFCMRDL